MNIEHLRMSTLKSYLSLIKFSHTIFAMPFALIGFFLAVRFDIYVWFIDYYRDYVHAAWETDYPGRSSIWIKLLLIILCMVFARSAAMAFNRYLDRRYSFNDTASGYKAKISRCNPAFPGWRFL